MWGRTSLSGEATSYVSLSLSLLPRSETFLVDSHTDKLLCDFVRIDACPAGAEGQYQARGLFYPLHVSSLPLPPPKFSPSPLGKRGCLLAFALMAEPPLRIVFCRYCGQDQHRRFKRFIAARDGSCTFLVLVSPSLPRTRSLVLSKLLDEELSPDRRHPSPDSHPAG